MLRPGVLFYIRSSRLRIEELNLAFKQHLGYLMPLRISLNLRHLIQTNIHHNKLIQHCEPHQILKWNSKAQNYNFFEYIY